MDATWLRREIKGGVRLKKPQKELIREEFQGSDGSTVFFCGFNKWKETNITCAGRAQFLVEKYKISEQNAKSSILESGCQCIHPMNCNSYYSAVEIGTSNFDTIIQRMAVSKPEATGLSVDAMKIYINQLPNLECWRKLNSAVVGSMEDIPPSGMVDTYFIDPKDIAQHRLPDWLKGCNSVGRPHATALKILKRRNLTHLMHSISVPVMSVEQLLDENEICRMKKFKVDVEGFDGDLLVAFSKWVQKKNGACYADEVWGEFNELSDGRVSGDEAGFALAEAGYKETGKNGFDRIWKYFGKNASMLPGKDAMVPRFVGQPSD
jgi:hypothetical protein